MKVIIVGRNTNETITRAITLFFLNIVHLCRLSLRIVYLKLAYSKFTGGINAHARKRHREELKYLEV